MELLLQGLTQIDEVSCLFINIPFNIYFTAKANQEVLPNQIYINLHNQNKVGCIVNDNNSLTLDSVYYHSDLILENIDKGPKQSVSVFIQPNPTLDTVLSLYLITYLVNRKVQPPYDLYHMLFHIIEEKVDDSILNLHALFLASIKLNNSEVTIKKLMAVIALIHSKIEEDPSATMPELIKNIKLDQFTFLENEIKLIKRDYQKYVNELKNSSISKEDTFEVLLENGELSKVKGRMNLEESESELIHYWLRRDGYAILLTKTTNKDGHAIVINKIDDRINFKNLCRSLSFFERQKSSSENEWTEHGANITCSNSNLQTDMIIDILKNYTDPWVSSQKVKYVFPFSLQLS